MRREVAEAFAMTQARAEADRPPGTGKYTILLSGRNLREMMQYYCMRSNVAVTYQKYSNFQIGGYVQGDEVKGDVLTINMRAKEPCSDEGILMKDRLLNRQGIAPASLCRLAAGRWRN